MGSLSDQITDTFEASSLPTLIDYVGIRCLSPAFDPAWAESGAIEHAITLLAEWASVREIAGLVTTVHRIKGRTPLLFIDIPPFNGGQGTALIYGHLDKQPPLGEWSLGLDPFTAVRRGDVLFGRGTCDDGYAIFSALGAIEAMEATGVSHGRCVVLIEASEESGSPDLDAHLDELAPLIAETDLVVCLDSGALDYERLWVTTSLRGNIVLTISAEVLDHGVHSGEASGVVPSSFRVLRQLLDRIEDSRTGEMTLPLFKVAPPDHLLAAAASLAVELGDPLAHHFPAVEGLELMGRDGADRLIRQSWSAALSVIGVDALPPAAEAGNVLRPSTSLKLSIRTPPSVDVHLAQAMLVEILEASPPQGARITVTPETPAQGWVAPTPHRWLADALDAASFEGFGQPPGLLGEGGSIPFLASLGHRFPDAEFVATGVLGPGSHAHGPNESLHIPATIGVTTALATILGHHADQPTTSSSISTIRPTQKKP
ncbi:MAG: M20/M25/M40 family metallo-hydrolase [Actinomycetes bacterium]